MTQPAICLTGIPFQPKTLEETAQTIASAVFQPERSAETRYIATVNTDFLLNVHGHLNEEICHSELFATLRRSLVNSVDGVPLIWAMRLLGEEIPERVAGVDLTIKLIELVGERGGRLFLLGGDEKVSQKAANLFVQKFPGLQIAGVACPTIHVCGPSLVDSSAKDALLIEQINQSNADLLLISLGNPKQEIWFERVRSQLKVPVAMGIGGSLTLLTGEIPRAPLWAQKWGMEWLFRLWNEPKRLWKRYILGIPKALALFTPLILYQNIMRLLSWAIYRHQSLSPLLLQGSLFLSRKHAFTIIPLPIQLDKETLAQVAGAVDEAFLQDMIILDFRYVRYIDLAGLEFLLQTWERAAAEEKRLYGIYLNGDIRWLLSFHHIWPLLSQSFLPSAKELITLLQREDNSITLYESLRQIHYCVIWSFFGQLSNTIDYELHLHQFEPIIYHKNCIIDLSYTTRIDNRGLEFLLQIKRLMQRQERILLLCSCEPAIKQIFKQMQLESAWTFCDSVTDALKLLNVPLDS